MLKSNVVKILNNLSAFICILMISSIGIFNSLSNGTSFNGDVILLFLCMLINPIVNLCRVKKYIINNYIYHIILIGISIFISFISINSIIKFYIGYRSDFGNSASLYFSNYLIPMMISILIILLISVFMKKEIVINKKDNSKVMLVVLAATSFLPFLNDTTTLSVAISIGVFIFSIVMIFKLDSLNTSSDLQKIYFVLAILCLITSNVIGLFLLVYMYIQLDYFGLNI